MKPNFEPRGFAFHTRSGARFCVVVFIALVWLAMGDAQAQTTTYTLGTSTLLVGPGAGTNSVILAVTPATGTWTATTNATWLHLSSANQSGTGSTNVIFNYDANPSATRSGTLTIAGQTLTVTQAGSTYVAAQPVTALVSSNLSGLGISGPGGVAVDGSGNVYIADTAHGAIKEWLAASNTVIILASGLSTPRGLALDGAGNVYVADSGDSTIREWTAANSNMTTLVSSGLSGPYGVAVDGSGNVYIADSGNNAIKEWTAANSNVTTLVSTDLNSPEGVAVDVAGNVYIGDSGDNAIKEWTAASSTVTTLISSGLNHPQDLAVDGGGNVYIADTGDNAIKEWTAANTTLTTLVSSNLSNPYGVAVDGLGNVYIAETAVEELPYAFVDTIPSLETLAAGSDALPMVLPASANLLAPFTPTSSAPSWLTISGITNGVVSFSFTATTTNRTGQITLLGQSIPVLQGSLIYYISTNALSEGPAAGSDTVLLLVSPSSATWTNTANAAWLHLSPANQNGAGSTDVVFSFDANQYATRIGTLTIAGQTLTVTQAGSNYTSSLSTNALAEGANSGSDSLVLTVIPPSSPWTNTANASWLHLSLANQSGTGSTNIVFSFDANPYGTRIGTLTIASQTLTVMQAGASYSLSTNALVEEFNPGSDSVVLTVIPQIATWTNTANASWLHLSTSNQSGIGSTNVVFSFDTNSGATRTGTLTIGGQTLTVTQSSPTYPLGTTARLEGPSAGSDSVLLALISSTTSWTAVANASWLHLSPANQSGEGSTNVIFTYDANSGATRTGTITIGSQTLTVTQAGSTYVAAGVATVLASGFYFPGGVAVDGAGNVFVGNEVFEGIGSFYGEICKWSPANNALTILASSNLYSPPGMAVDGVGNVYFANYPIGQSTSGVYELMPAISNVIALISTGVNDPEDVAVDGSGNVYIADTGDNAIKEWTVANSNLITLVSSGLSSPAGVAVDAAGNVYIADTGHNAIKEWTVANSNVITLVSSGLISNASVVVDGSGNLYIADTGVNPIKEWTVANNTLTTLVSSGLSGRVRLAVDGSGNVYFANSGNGATAESLYELPYAFVDPTPKLESLAAGSDALPMVLPATANLLAPFAPYTDKPWLTISGITNGVVSFSFNAAVSNRMGYITILGQSILITQSSPGFSLGATALSEPPTAGNDSVFLYANPNTDTWIATANAAWLHLSPTNQTGTGSTSVDFSYDENPGSTRAGTLTIAGQTLTVTQGGLTFTLSTNTRLEGQSAGSDSVILTMNLNFGAWTNTANATWLHFSPSFQSGTGNTNVIFSFDANPGATRTGTLTIAGQTLTVTQAGSTYVAAGVVTVLASGLTQPTGVAVDSAGNVYIGNGSSGVIYTWSPANNILTTLVSSELYYPVGMAVDGVGNVYFANFVSGQSTSGVYEWMAANSNVTELVTTGVNDPKGVAVDGSGNVYIADTGDNAIKEWIAANSNLIALVSSGLSSPTGVAVDAAGNVYITDTGNNAIKEWTAANNTLTTLLSSGLSSPSCVEVDGSGNLYITDTGDNAVKEWTAANNTLTTLVSSGLSGPGGLAVDGSGNIYIADNGNHAVKELPHAFVDPTPKMETAATGSDALPLVLPATENLLPPFAPTCDQSWLTISSVANGVVSFSFTLNTGSARTAHIILLGQSIPITQAAPVIGTPPTLTGVLLLGSGIVQFAFTNIPGATFTVVSTTNLSLPFTNWTVVGSPVESPPGMYQFTSQPTTNDAQLFYGVLSP